MQAVEGANSSDRGSSNDAIASKPDDNFTDGQSISSDRLALRKTTYASLSKDAANPKERGKIDPGAVDPYTRAEYPDVVHRWGKKIKQIDRERRQAAEIAVADPRCDGVINAQVSDKGTSTDHHFWVECNNITRFYFDSASLARHQPAHVQTQADMGNNGLVTDW